MIYAGGEKGCQEDRRLINGPSAQNVILMTTGSTLPPQLLEWFSPLYILKAPDDKQHICLPKQLDNNEGLNKL